MANNDESSSNHDQLHFVLVNGASHGAWCWYKIRALLEAAGHKATCLDLRCSGVDPTDFNTVSEFDDYNKPLTSFMSSLPPNQKVILVGHSIGGQSVTDAIHNFAAKIHVAVYVAGAMFKYGSPAPIISTGSDHNNNNSSNKNINDRFDFVHGLGVDQPPTGMIVKPQFWRTALYNQSPIEDYTLASMLLRPAPARALINVRFDGGPSADDVPRVFIRTMQDQLMSQNSQDFMISQWPPSQVYAIESDHSPFFSAPQVLFRFLVEAASATCHV